MSVLSDMLEYIAALHCTCAMFVLGFKGGGMKF